MKEKKVRKKAKWPSQHEPINRKKFEKRLRKVLNRCGYASDYIDAKVEVILKQIER